jgi:hypothetical protein
LEKRNADEIARLLAGLMKEHKLNLSDVNRGMVVLSNIEHIMSWGRNKRVVPPIKEGASCSITAHKEAVLDPEAECTS